MSMVLKEKENNNTIIGIKWIKQCLKQKSSKYTCHLHIQAERYVLKIYLCTISFKLKFSEKSQVLSPVTLTNHGKIFTQVILCPVVFDNTTINICADHKQT